MRVFIALFLLLGLSSRLQGQSARLFCANTIFDFGIIPQTQEVRHAFTLSNTGTTSLVITHIQNCCGINLSLASTNIPAGKHEQLEVVFNPSNYSGSVRKAIYLHTNDPEAKIIAFRMVGTVTRPPIPSPQTTKSSQ